MLKNYNKFIIFNTKDKINFLLNILVVFLVKMNVFVLNLNTYLEKFLVHNHTHIIVILSA